MESFQQTLRKTVVERIDPKLSRKEVLDDIFKTYVAKMLEQNVLANKNRLSADYIAMIKGYLITEFRATELGEHQMSEEMYSNLFDMTLKEIFNSADHEGNDVVEKAKEYADKSVVQSEGRFKKTAGGIWL